MCLLMFLSGRAKPTSLSISSKISLMPSDVKILNDCALLLGQCCFVALGFPLRNACQLRIRLFKLYLAGSLQPFLAQTELQHFVSFHEIFSNQVSCLKLTFQFVNSSL